MRGDRGFHAGRQRIVGALYSMECDDTAIDGDGQKPGTPLQQRLAPLAYQPHGLIEALGPPRFWWMVEVGINSIQRTIGLVQLQGALKEILAPFASGKMCEVPAPNRRGPRLLVGFDEFFFCDAGPRIGVENGRAQLLQKEIAGNGSSEQFPFRHCAARNKTDSFTGSKELSQLVAHIFEAVINGGDGRTRKQSHIIPSIAKEKMQDEMARA